MPRSSSPETRHYYRHVSRLSAAFAFLADMSMLAMGGALKRKEKISGRLGDVLSMLYLVSATLKRYEDEGRIRADLPLVRWAVRDALYRAQQAIDGILSNFPVKALATLLRWIIFPLGATLPPAARLAQPRVREIALEPGAARDRLTAGMYVPRPDGGRERRRHRPSSRPRSSPPSPASRSTRSCARRVKKGKIAPRAGVRTI